MTGRSMRQRIAAVGVFFAALFAALALRVVQLTTVQGDGPQAARRPPASSQRADRRRRAATIVDRYGEPLAMSRESAAVYLRPRDFAGQPDAISTVARLLDVPRDVVVQRASATAPFVWLTPPGVARSVESAWKISKLRGIGSEPTRQRVYPHGAARRPRARVHGHRRPGPGGHRACLGCGVAGRGGGPGRRARRAGAAVRDGGGDRWGSLPRAGAQRRADHRRRAAARRREGARARRARVRARAAGSLVVARPAHRRDAGDGQRAALRPESFRRRHAPTRSAIAPSPTVYEPGSTFKAVLAAAALEERRGAARGARSTARTATTPSATAPSATRIRTAS